MSWLAVREGMARTRHIGATREEDKLDWGTLALEIDLAEFAKARGPILRLAVGREPQRIFTLEPMQDGRLHLLRRHGREVSHLSIGLGREPISGCLRLSYHWDNRRARSLLTAENLTRGTIRQQEARHALPLLSDEIEALFGPSGRRVSHTALEWVALADHWQTVGPMPGLAPDTMVATPAGPRPVAELQAGDLVQTADHGPLPILWQGRVHAPDVGRFRSARLLAPYFGLYRDLVVQPSQRLALSGVDVEYHFGEEEVLVEARHLVNGETAVWDDGGDVAACHGLLLDRHALISANGIWTETLYFARIARNPELARTTAPAALGGMKELPVHDRPARRELLDFEALALNAARLRSRSPLVA